MYLTLVSSQSIEFRIIEKMSRKDKVRFFRVLLVALIVVVTLSIVVLSQYQGNIRMESYEFTESSRELQNPGRGFYNLYRFMITDEKENYWQLIRELYASDSNTTLSLVEINLQAYREHEISGEGLDNIECLFQALGDLDKQLIVRFVYDWDGENEQVEPETIDIILGHMGQLHDILHKYSKHIFILQGLFIGNWGEMNGTKYFEDEDLIRLTEKLEKAVDRSTFLAVRTPSQWRRITRLQDVTEDVIRDDFLAGRISLYNDGMLGNESDYGTYILSETGGTKYLKRNEELAFQKELCCWVPNGGEVINDNFYNDFDNAVKDLATMHVSYLNAGHDQKVLNKWKKKTVMDEGCFQGMDGYTYIERHLGYRLLIKEVGLHHNSFSDYIDVEVTVKNVGFAPLYSNPRIEIVLRNQENDEELTYEMYGNLCRLSGKPDGDDDMTLSVSLRVDELSGTKYDVYFVLADLKTEERILLANEQDADEYGYCIGTIELGN